MTWPLIHKIIVAAFMEGVSVQKKILLADDNKTFLMYIGLLLKRLGFQLLTARNGLDALKVLKTTSIDLVILDVHMETLDGITTLRHIKSNALTAHVPVIMLSTDMSPETITACKDLGCFDYMQKPVKVDLLHDAIQRSFFDFSGYGRKHIRTACNEKVIVDFSGKKHSLYAEMCSGGGLYVRSEDPIPTGSDVVVSLHLGNGEQRHYKGKVIYTKNEFGDFSAMSPGMAIQFTELSQQDELELNDYIKTLVAADIFEEQGEIKILER